VFVQFQVIRTLKVILQAGLILSTLHGCAVCFYPERFQ